MPVIKPFRGYRYNASKVKSLEKVLSPPYDVISKEAQARLYENSPYNFVRLDLKKRGKKGHPYREVARELNQWIRRRIFLREKEDALYIYAQRYRNLLGQWAERVGFIALMDVDPRRVLRHEDTLLAPREDRMRLLANLRAHLSSIFGLYQDPKGKVQRWLRESMRQRPAVNVALDGIQHRLYVENRPARIRRIAADLKHRDMYIADGHHRYRVSLEYHRSLRRQGRRGDTSRHVLTYLCDADRNDLVIYPTHRLLRGLDRAWEARLEKQIRRHFNVENFKTLAALLKSLDRPRPGRVQLGVVSSVKGRTYRKLVAKQKTRDVDVRVAHRYLIAPLLRGEDITRSRRIHFTRDPREVSRRVRGGEATVGFLLSRMPVREMMRLSKAGTLLPQKSTYFYPKLLSGLVFHRF